MSKGVDDGVKVVTVEPSGKEVPAPHNYEETNSSMKEFLKGWTTPEQEGPAPWKTPAWKMTGFVGKMVLFMNWFFNMEGHGGTISKDLIGGFTTFLSMAYIMAVNPIILTGTGMPGTFFATALSAGIFTFSMGLFVNVPIALAPGMGLNGYFATVADSFNGKMKWDEALACVFVSGCIYLVLTFTGIRFILFKAVPPSIRSAMTAGIGMFICVIGLKIGEIMKITVTFFAPQTIPPFTQTRIFFLNWDLWIEDFTMGADRAPLLTLIGVFLLTVLLSFNVPASVLFTICFCTLIGIPMGCTNIDFWKSGEIPWFPDMTKLAGGKFNFDKIGQGIFWEVVFTFLFVELFDSFGTLVGTLNKAGLLKDRIKGERIISKAMCVDGFGLSLGSVMGANSVTCYIESATGIAAGARTGLASMLTGSCFLLSLLFLNPFVKIIPDAATAPALILVGCLSLSAVKEIEWDDIAVAMPAFLTIVLMGFTYSIANGISAGIVFYTLVNTIRNFYGWAIRKATGSDKYAPSRYNPVHWLLYPIAAYMFIRFILLK